MKDCDFAWGNGDNVLRHINVNIKKGSLVAVVGKVGCDKTSFVSALIGEMTKNSGACMVNGTLSTPLNKLGWLMILSEAILFLESLLMNRDTDVLFMFVAWRTISRS